MKYDAIVVHGGDNVATALRGLSAGEAARFANGGEKSVALLGPVKFGHKFAISEIKKDDEVKKYGETIGRATVDIAAGEHVHTQNVESLRGRGDRA